MEPQWLLVFRGIMAQKMPGALMFPCVLFAHRRGSYIVGAREGDVHHSAIGVCFMLFVHERVLCIVFTLHATVNKLCT